MVYLCVYVARNVKTTEMCCSKKKKTQLRTKKWNQSHGVHAVLIRLANHAPSGNSNSENRTIQRATMGMEIERMCGISRW